MGSALHALLKSLRRRRVTQVAFAYAAMAWLLLQIGEIVFKALLVPDWALRLLLVLLLLGYPLAIALAWFFDLTPSGVQRTGDEESAASDAAHARERRARGDAHSDRRAAATSAPVVRWRKLWLPIGLTLAVVLTVGLLFRFNQDPAVSASQRAASIAILPFTSLSNNKTDAYFAEGLAVELQDALAGVKGLKVAALGSGSTPVGRDVKQLGKTLGVATVLNASVRRDGTRVRINARLSDTATGFILWSRSYDRETSDVFAVQSEIANEVVTALRGVLPGDRKVLAKRLAPTRNVGAYDSYLKGLHQLQQPGTGGHLDRAVTYFKGALAADPGFARAQAGICRAGIRRFEGARDAKAFERAQAACSRAAGMDPGLREVGLALGDLYRVRGEMGKAIEHYSRAIQEPGLRAEAYIGLAQVHGAQDRPKLALEYFERARALQPGNARIYRELGYYYYANGDLPKAIAAYRKATTLQAPDSGLWSSLGGLYWVSGDAVQAEQAFQRSLAIEPNYAALSNLGMLKYDAGSYAEAAELFRQSAVLEPDDFRPWGNIGDALTALPGSSSQASEAYERAARLAEAYVRVKSNDTQAIATLAWFRAKLGDADGARELIARCDALGTASGEVELLIAQTLALLGDTPGALKRLRRAKDGGVTEQRIRTSPQLRRLLVSTS